MHIDPISDMLTRIRNASVRKLAGIEMPYTKMNESIAKVLKSAGYVEEVKVFKVAGTKKSGLSITLGYDKGEPRFQALERVSKPSLRVYKKYEEIDFVLNGYGMYVVSTSRGVMSSVEAKKKKLGGELICKVY